MRLSKNKLRLLHNYFSNQPAIQKVHLFGSFARGEATAKSDVDLLVVLNYDFYQQEWNISKFGQKLKPYSNAKLIL